MRTSKEIFFLLGALFISIVHGHQLSDKRKCADSNCEELISVGTTVNRYDAPAAGLVSFPKDADVKIYSKEAGSNPLLWGVEIRGQKGYANKGFIKETKVLIQDQLLTHEVPTRQILTIETDNVSGDEEDDEPDEELDDELNDELDDRQIDSSNNYVDSDKKELNGGEFFYELGEDADPNTSALNSQPSAQLNDHIAQHSVDNGLVVPKVPTDYHLSENANDLASSTPIVSTPTPLEYDVVDGTIIYADDDSSVIPQYLSETETPPPSPQMTQTLPPIGISKYFSSNSDSEFTPNLEVVPSGEPRDMIMPSEVVSDMVASTAADSSVSRNLAQETVEPLTNSSPLLLSTLSVAVSDNSQVHATTSSVKEQTLGSSQVGGSEIVKDGFLTAGDAKQSAPSKLDDKLIEPSAVEQESVGFLSSITSSFANIFESPKAEKDSDEVADRDVDKSTEERGNDKKEVAEEKSSTIVQHDHDSFVPTPKQQDIITVAPNIQISKETSEQIESVPLISSAVVIKETEISVDISQVTEYIENIPQSNSSDPIAQLENELNTQVPNNSSYNNAVEPGEISSSLSSTDNRVSDAAHKFKKDEINVGEDSGSEDFDGSGSANVEGSDPANGEGSVPANVESSDPANIKGSEPSNVESSDLSNVEGSSPSSVEGSGPINVEDSDPANVKGPDPSDVEDSGSLGVGSLGVVESSRANAFVDAGSTAEDHDSNVDELPSEENLDSSDSNNLQASDIVKLTRISPEQFEIHKFITNKNGDHSDVKHDETIGIKSTSSKNDQDNSYPHPETTIILTERHAFEKIIEEVSSEPANLKDAEVISESFSSHDGFDGDAKHEMELPSLREVEDKNFIVGMEAHLDHHEHSQIEDQGLNVQDKDNQGFSGSNQEKQDLSGLELHDPNTIAGKLMQVAEPIMGWLSSLSQLGDSLSLALESETSQEHLSSRTLLSLLLVAFTFVVVMLYSVHALLMKCSREGPLLEALNVMEHEHHVAAAVIMQLQEKLVAATSGSPASGAERTIMHDSAEVARLMEQLQLMQEEATSRVTRIQELEQELEESTSSGLEMHAMLQDLLHEQRDTAGFQDSVDHLQKMLDNQREKVESLTSDLSIKTTLNDELKSETKMSREKITKLEYQLEQVTHSLEEVSSSKDRVQHQLTEEQSRAQAVSNQLRDLTQDSDQASAALMDLQSKYTASEQKTERLQKLLRTKETELHVTKECLKQLKLFNDFKGSKEKLTQMLDVIKVQAQLSTSKLECSDLQQQLQQRADEAAGLEEAAREAKAEAARCLGLQQESDSERSDALSKLAVLTSYFQEKEAQLTKELESESGLRHNAEGSAETVSSRIRDYDSQLLAYKTQVEGLKKELDDQEQSYRAQLAAQEQKAHESWVAARAAERKLDESKQETSQLRSRLLLASKEGADNHAIVKPNPKHSEISNGSLSSPRPPLHDDLDGEHCLPLNPMDSPPHIPPPHMLPPHLFSPHGAPPLPHGMPPFPPPPGMHPPGMHPPHHFLPPPLPPPMLSDRRLPPAGRLASPSFHRRSPPDYLDRHRPPSPPFDHRRSPAHYDRRSYSPSSEHSRYSDRQGRYSPDRHSERQFSDLRQHNDRYHLHNNGGDRHLDRYSPERLRDSSPDRWLNRSPDGYARKPSPPRRQYDDQHRKGKKTSTPLGPNDR